MDVQSIDKQTNNILNGTTDLSGFNQQEHAGICSAGPSLIGALIVCNHTRESLAASRNAAAGQAAGVSNWEIDEAQEKAVQKWAEEKGIWVPQSEEWLTRHYGPKNTEQLCGTQGNRKTMDSIDWKALATMKKKGCNKMLIIANDGGDYTWSLY